MDKGQYHQYPIQKQLKTDITVRAHFQAISWLSFLSAKIINGYYQQLVSQTEFNLAEIG
jgi:hypothetical protein